MPVIPDPTPSWLKAENASVTDSPLTKALRSISHLLGGDDPQSQALSLMAPMEVGEAGGITGAIQKFIKAYHGSPHDFDQFLMSKVGTGEGAQAFGHGLYFAENPEVASGYAQRLRRVMPITDEELSQYYTPGRVVPGYAGNDRVVEFRPNSQNGNWAVKVERVDSTGKAIEPPRWHATSPTRAEADQVLGNTRQGMYEVALHADPESFLDWDKPLNQQTPAVQQAMKSHVDYLKGRPLAEWARARIESGQATGHDIYNWLGGERAIDESMKTWPAPMPNPKELGSAALKEAGIPGIKYLDQGSRSTGTGTSNYVVLDDQVIKILKKYGFLLPAAGGGYEVSKPFGDKSR